MWTKPLLATAVAALASAAAGVSSALMIDGAYTKCLTV